MKHSITVSYLFIIAVAITITSTVSFVIPTKYHVERLNGNKAVKHCVRPVSNDPRSGGVIRFPFTCRTGDASVIRNMVPLKKNSVASTRNIQELAMSTTKDISEITKNILPVSVEKNRKKRFATMMAFVTGIADLALNMKYKTFATMMTGNTMWMALAAAECRYLDIGFYASVIASYLLGLAVFRKTDLTLRERSMQVCALLVSFLFVGSDVIFHLTNAKWIPVMMLAAGFAIVNSVGMEVAGTLTFVITGHMTKVTNQIFDRFSRTAGRNKLSPSDKKALVLNMFVIAGFFMGALFASFLKCAGLIKKTGLFSVMGITYGTLFLWQDMEAMDGAWWLRKGERFCDLDDDGKICDDDQED